MDIKDLTPDEDLVFMGLLREVIQADGEYSFEEREEVAALEEKMGSARFLTAMNAAKKIESLAALKEHAKHITRVEAQRVIMDFLIHIAAVDGVDADEEKPLRWLASWWNHALD